MLSLLKVLVSIPVVTVVVSYYFLLPTWSWTKSEEFQNIKGALVKYGSVSSKDAENFSIKNITDSNIDTWDAIHLTQDDLVGLHLLKFILPLIVVLGIFIALYLKLQIPGVTRRVDLDIRKREEEYLDRTQDKTYDSLKSYNAVIISVNGFIISVLGFFLVSSSAGTPGGGNPYFFLGFETIVFSLIASLLTHWPFTGFDFINRLSMEKRAMTVLSLKQYFKIANFASACLILGLLIIVASIAA